MRFALREIKQRLGRIRIRPSQPRTSVVRPVVDVHALVDQSQSSGILKESTQLKMSSSRRSGATYVSDKIERF